MTSSLTPIDAKLLARFPILAMTIARQLAATQISAEVIARVLGELGSIAPDREARDRGLLDFGNRPGAAVNLRSLLVRLRERADFPASVGAELEAVLEVLPDHFRRGEMRFTSDFVSGFAEQWKRDLAGLVGRPARCLEIGAAEGHSAVWLCENVLTHEDARLTCVDTFDFGGQPVATLSNAERSLEAQFRANLACSGQAHKIETIVGSSQQVMRTLPLGAFDYIYVDGSHLPRDVLEDAVLAYRLLKVGALVTFDDYASDTNSAVRPKVALDAFVSVFGDAMTEVHRGWQLTLRREK